jgi:hypothetical protein
MVVLSFAGRMAFLYVLYIRRALLGFRHVNRGVYRASVLSGTADVGIRIPTYFARLAVGFAAQARAC